MLIKLPICTFFRPQAASAPPSPMGARVAWRRAQRPVVEAAAVRKTRLEIRRDRSPVTSCNGLDLLRSRVSDPRSYLPQASRAVSEIQAVSASPDAATPATCLLDPSGEQLVLPSETEEQLAAALKKRQRGHAARRPDITPSSLNIAKSSLHHSQCGRFAYRRHSRGLSS